MAYRAAVDDGRPAAGTAMVPLVSLGASAPFTLVR